MKKQEEYIYYHYLYVLDLVSSYSFIIAIIVTIIRNRLQYFTLDEIRLFLIYLLLRTLIYSILSSGIVYLLNHKKYQQYKIGKCPYCHKKNYTNEKEHFKCSKCHNEIIIKDDYFCEK